jgi:hypothetical protein
MERLRSKEALGVLGVVVAIAAGATLPIVLSSVAGAHSSFSPSQKPVAACSPPGITGTTAPGTTPPKAKHPPVTVCTPALSATPDTGLADGQTITVTGTGFSANTGIGMVECEPGAIGPDQCDLSTLLELTSDGSGDFTTPYTVARILNVSNGDGTSTQIDCATAACMIGAADISDYSVAAGTPLSFNPSLPLELTGTLNHKGTVRPRAGVATISGTVTCATPTTVDVDVELTQFYKRFVFNSQGESVVLCGPTAATWTVAIPPGNGLYGVGKSMADVYLEAEFGTSYRDVEISGNVKLAKGKP